MAEESLKQPVTVSRETLYQQAWDKPMSRLAADYGISGNGLAKICDRLNIPYPPRGYWAKKAAGHKVVQYRLPALKDDTPNEVTITPTPPPPPPVQLPPEFADQLSAARERINDVAVPERLSSRPACHHRGLDRGTTASAQERPARSLASTLRLPVH